MYTFSAPYYDTIFAFKNYEADASRLREWIRQYRPEAKSILDVACGTGRHLGYFQDDFDIAGVDINQEMIDTARRRCPRGDFRLGDMVDFRFERRFDVVMCLFSSIMYTKTVERMHKAVLNMARHLAPGGLLIVEPWFTPERYFVNHLKLNVSDSPELKIVWMYTTHREGKIGWWDIHYLIGTPEGVEHCVEHHEVGLFTDEEYRQGFEAAGLQVEYDNYGLHDRAMYFGLCPREPAHAGHSLQHLEKHS